METDYELFTSLRYDQRLLQSTENTRLANDKSSPFYMLEYHRDRLLQAAKHFQWLDAISVIEGPKGLESLREVLDSKLETSSGKPHRVKVLLSQTGKIDVEIGEVPSVSIEQLFPDSIPPPQAVKASPAGQRLDLHSYDAQHQDSSQPTGTRISAKTGGALALGPRTHIVKAPPTPWTIVVDTSRTCPSSRTSYKTTGRDMYNAARTRAGISSMAEQKEVILVNTGGEIMEGSLTSPYFWRDGRWVTPPASSGGQLGTTRRWLLEKNFCEEAVIRADEVVDGEECWISNGVRGLIWGKIQL